MAAVPVPRRTDAPVPGLAAPDRVAPVARPVLRETFPPVRRVRRRPVRRRGPSVGRIPAVGALFAATVLLAAVAGCARSGDAEPESTVFGFDGATLNVVARHHVPTDLVAADRQDVKVTRWFKADGIGRERAEWTLEGDTLTLEASCSGFANCDARFRVEVPPHVAVLRDGRATDLKGHPRT
ncbi:hypothetical protein ACFCX4_04925 [Kitasatospora sp. NPDC056327]|uniref:hypothetical protein n=1 Tax=Kitasatospora sp. NPDC056327 TaxID=3345785 RepID=UPI0035E24C1B